MHQQNKLDAAAALYRQVLQATPDQFDATHLLGVIARQQGDPGTARDLIAKALASNPDHATAHCNLGAALGDLGRLPEALASYERAIALKPDYALAICNRGNTLRKLGRPDEAAQCYARALALNPAYPEAHCNLALLLQEAGHPVEALAAANGALQHRSRYAEAWCVRADALQSLQRFDEALASYDKAIAIDPARAQTHCSRGTALQRMQRFQDAIDSYTRAIALQPQYPLAYRYRGNSWRTLQRADEAIADYQTALAQGGDADEIAFSLASLGVGQTPAAPPRSYVTALFDNYAGHFDEHLTGKLAYRIPALLDAALRRHLGDNQHDTLDLGCGTGLFGPLLRPHSRTLTGIDLSEKMLEKARERQLYDTLACAELSAYLSQAGAQFDLIVAADVFVYIGDLEPVFRHAGTALRAHGVFAFSVEAGERSGYTLAPSHRYAHSLDYIRALAAAGGFAVLEVQTQAGRNDHNADITAHTVVLRRAG